MADYTARRTAMVDTQVRPSDVTKFPIIDAMLRIPRENFVPAGLKEAAYVGENLDIGNGRFILEPRTFSKMLDALNIQPDEMVLDLGCGLGYSSAVIAHLADAVVAVEADGDVAAEAQKLLVENSVDNAAVVAEPFAKGAAKHGPYDVIVVEGAVEEIPADLLSQLKEGGRIAAIFQQDALGVCRVGHKIDGTMTWRDTFNASAPVLDGFEEVAAFVF